MVFLSFEGATTHHPSKDTEASYSLLLYGYVPGHDRRPTLHWKAGVVLGRAVVFPPSHRLPHLPMQQDSIIGDGKSTMFCPQLMTTGAFCFVYDKLSFSNKWYSWISVCYWSIYLVSAVVYYIWMFLKIMYHLFFFI